MFMGFFLAAAIVSFLFIGQLLMNADDIYTKKYSATSFARKDDKRISIRRKDQKFMTKKDIDQLTKMKHVVSVDQYDIVETSIIILRKEKIIDRSTAIIG